MSDGRAAPGRAIPGSTGARGGAASRGVVHRPHGFARREPRFAPPSRVPPAREGSRGVDPFPVLSGSIPMHAHHGACVRPRGRAVSRLLPPDRRGRDHPFDAAVPVPLLGLCLALPGSRDPAALDPAGVVRSCALSRRRFPPDHGSINDPTRPLGVEAPGGVYARGGPGVARSGAARGAG